MKNINRIAASLMAAALFIGANTLHAQTGGQPVPQSAAQTPQRQDWNTPPAGTEQEQQGYRDGIEAAKLDTAAHRKVDPKASHLYVHPPVKGAAVTDYRAGFEGGYQAAVQNQNGR